MSMQPTFTGYVANTRDALLLFQATISGRLPQVSRRPHDRERTQLIKSGAVFVFNEQTSGIKRWTDGVAWSPSRILGNFLVYRQLEKPFGPGEKKKTAKRGRKKNLSISQPYDLENHRQDRLSASSVSHNDAISMKVAEDLEVGDSNGFIPNTRYMEHRSINSSEEGSTTERSLVGSLVDSYTFKEDGLIKKTLSVVINGQNVHMVSYYRPEDVVRGIFQVPSETAMLKNLTISDELIRHQNFRVPLEPSGYESAVPQGPGLGSSHLQYRHHSSQQQSQQRQQHRPQQQHQPQHNMGVPPSTLLPHPQDYQRSRELDINTNFVEVDFFDNHYFNTANSSGIILGSGNSRANSALPLSSSAPSNGDGSSTGTNTGGSGSGNAAASGSTGQYVSGYRPFSTAVLPNHSQGSQLPLPQYQGIINGSGNGSGNSNVPTSMNGSANAGTLTKDFMFPPPSMQPNIYYSNSNSGSGNNSRQGSTISASESPSLPPLGGIPGYSYQQHAYEYQNCNTNGLGNSDPRRLPDEQLRHSPHLQQPNGAPRTTAYGGYPPNYSGQMW